MAERPARSPRWQGIASLENSLRLDLEDYHSGEQEKSGEADLAHGLAARVQSLILSRALFDRGIRRNRPGLRIRVPRAVTAIHNTFPLPRTEPDFRPSPGDGLLLYCSVRLLGRTADWNKVSKRSV